MKLLKQSILKTVCNLGVIIFKTLEVIGATRPIALGLCTLEVRSKRPIISLSQTVSSLIISKRTQAGIHVATKPATRLRWHRFWALSQAPVEDSVMSPPPLISLASFAVVARQIRIGKKLYLYVGRRCPMLACLSRALCSGVACQMLQF